MLDTSSTNNLKNTMRCKIPITPAFGSVMDATSEGTINDQTLGQLGIRAIHIEGMHHRYVRGENPAKNKSVSSPRKDVNSSHCPSARKHLRSCPSVATLSMDW